MIKTRSIGLLLLLALTACSKEDSIFRDIDYNRLSLLVSDNFNLSVYSATLNRSGLYNTLLEDGPFTALAPSDAAFAAAGYANSTSMLTEAIARVSRIANYHVLNGTYDFNKLPYLFNQEIRSRGGKLYVSHWIKGQDTVLTVNGARVLSQNIQASNGLIQVISRMLEPYEHDELASAIQAETSLTLFSQAMDRSGLLATLQSAGPFTVFAPDNAAMQAYGFATMQAVNEADPAELAALLRYHIVQDRRFINDYILSTGESNTSRQAMLDGNTITVSLIPSANVPGGFSGIRLQGTGNTAQVDILKQDILTGNGVLHIVNGALRITR